MITHLEDATKHSYDLGHLRCTWTMLGEGAGSRGVGVRRIEIEAGGWSTPAHEHGREEEIFYVLSGRGLSWQRGRTTAIRDGDCILYLPKTGAHTVHALEPLDLLAFGTRFDDESVGFPRLGASLVGRRAAETTPGAIERAPFQFVRESELGPPELPEAPGDRPATIVNVADVEPQRVERGRVARTRRNCGRAAGSVAAGLQHVEVEPGRESTAQHCHSLEEELFVILDGDGVLILDSDETPVRAGHVVSRPPGTGVSHVFRAGERGLTYLAYGTREPGDVCYYPRSNKIAWRGVGVMARLERIEDYWDGEE